MERTTCCVVGGGPAGMVLGLLLARAGVDVVVLEKHADFLRDFRGDTVHVSTQTLIDQLGLGESFARIPQRPLDRVEVKLAAGTARIALHPLPGPHPHIQMVPQWDLLDMLAEVATEEPTFRLIRNAEVVGLRHEGARVAGVRYRDPGGVEHDLAATLTVGCDGRGSAVRAAAGLRPRSFGAPMDVWWFRLARRADDPGGGVGRVAGGRVVLMLDRGDYWQCAYLIRKGSDTALRAAGIQALRNELGDLAPWLGDRPDVLETWDDIKLLDVRLERLRRWYAGGLLLIGDAAHAMSPIGGVGINLAVQDAVAAARMLAGPLRTGRVDKRVLRRVQLRRWWPTAGIQGIQRFAHTVMLRRVLEPSTATSSGASRLPLPVRLLQRFPVLQAVPLRLIAIGPLPEQAPRWAQRHGGNRPGTER